MRVEAIMKNANDLSQVKASKPGIIKLVRL